MSKSHDWYLIYSSQLVQQQFIQWICCMFSLYTFKALQSSKLKGWWAQRILGHENQSGEPVRWFSMVMSCRRVTICNHLHSYVNHNFRRYLRYHLFWSILLRPISYDKVEKPIWQVRGRGHFPASMEPPLPKDGRLCGRGMLWPLHQDGARMGQVRANLS